MGGPGSGSWYRWNKRDTTDEHRSLDIRAWHRKRLLRPGSTISTTWWRGERQTGAISAVVVSRRLVLLVYRVRRGGDWQDARELVPSEWTPCHYGGERPWFRCPGRGCGRRAAVLYGGGTYFLCRHCYGLAYESQREAARSRALRRAQSIRRRLGGSASLLEPFPEKPKRMRWRTYERLLRAYEAAELENWVGLHAWLERVDRRIAQLPGR